jgi:hypothetical protein
MTLEGINYRINWKTFVRGTSIFLPCLNVPAAKATARALAKRLRFKVLTKAVISDGIQGLRIWRL